MKSNQLCLARKDVFATFDPNQDTLSIRGQLFEIMNRVLESSPAGNRNFLIARAICVFLVMQDLHDHIRPTLTGVLRHLLAGPNHIRHLLAKSEGNPALDGWHESLGRLLEKKVNESPQDFARHHCIAEEALREFVQSKTD